MPTGLSDVNGVLYFTANDGINGQELWASNGTDQGTLLVQDINPGVSGSNPVNLTVAGANLFFVAMDEFGTAQLFGGTTSIVLPVTDLSLHGKAVNEDVQLQWETLQE